MEGHPDYDGYSLPLGTCLHDTYQISGVLGEGGFAIIYICVHIPTGKSVAVKEYFPSGLAKRECQHGLFCVQPLQNSTMEFEKGQRHFLEEARIMKECRNLPGIVTVHDFFEENHTVYIVMEYIEGPTLEQYIHTNGALPYTEMIELMTPIIHSLEKIHEKGLIHCDISPDNLILGLDNQLHLIDFGAAQIKSTDKKEQQTIILKKGFAPPEQYLVSGNTGTWSDVYALCATMYFAISGKAPVASIDRLQEDTLEHLSSLADFPAYIASVIERGLSLHPADRFKTMGLLYHALENPTSVENNRTIIGNTLTQEEQRKLTKLENGVHRSPRSFWIRSCAVCLAILVGGAGLWYAIRSQVTEYPDRKKTGTDTVVSSTTSAPLFTNNLTTSSALSETVPVAPASQTPPTLCKMVNVTNLSVADAKKKLHALDASIQVQIKKKYSPSVQKGHVLSQSVQKNTIFNAGSLDSITLTVSRGKQKIITSAAPTDSTVHRQTPTASPRSDSSNDFQIKNKPSQNSFEID